MLNKHTIEFVCLPPGEEDSFALYLESENTRRNGGREKVLSLCYPDARERNEAFNEFFQSPSRVNRFSHVYEGIFAVNLTGYVREAAEDRLTALLEFTEENPGMDYVLYAVTDKRTDAERFLERLSLISNRCSGRIVESGYRPTFSERGTEGREKRRAFGY